MNNAVLCCSPSGLPPSTGRQQLLAPLLLVFWGTGLVLAQGGIAALRCRLCLRCRLQIVRGLRDEQVISRVR